MHPLETRLGFHFADPAKLIRALTHRSYVNENRQADIRHNERLEFLGDAVLELVVTDHLFAAMPKEDEGQLTALRAALVRKENLAMSARSLELGQHLRLSKGEEQTGGRENDYLLANAMEALIGAIYLDQGLEQAQTLIHDHVLTALPTILQQSLHRDPKSQLQELSQDKLKLTPSYQILSDSGPDHDKTFEAGVFLDGELKGQGSGGSKRSAELAAAEDALHRLGWLS